MRKIVAGLFITLDGIVESPEKWHFPYMNDEMQQAVGAQIAANDVVLYGRKTYTIFAESWGPLGSDVPFADDINNARKVVVSDTLTSADWRNSSLVRGHELRSRLAALKEEPGQNIGVSGSVTLVRSLLTEGLLDELTLLVHPLVLGTGMRLFPEGFSRTPLTLVGSQTFSTGVLNLTFAPADH